MDRTYDLWPHAAAGDGTANDSGGMNIHDTFFKNVNIPIEYDATAAAITGIRSMNIGVLTISKNGAAAFASKMRIRFSDSG